MDEEGSGQPSHETLALQPPSTGFLCGHLIVITFGPGGLVGAGTGLQTILGQLIS